jgi:hypothetical protein
MVRGNNYGRRPGLPQFSGVQGSPADAREGSEMAYLRRGGCAAVVARTDWGVGLRSRARYSQPPRIRGGHQSAHGQAGSFQTKLATRAP